MSSWVSFEQSAGVGCHWDQLLSAYLLGYWVWRLTLYPAWTNTKCNKSKSKKNPHMWKKTVEMFDILVTQTFLKLTSVDWRFTSALITSKLVKTIAILYLESLNFSDGLLSCSLDIVDEGQSITHLHSSHSPHHCLHFFPTSWSQTHLVNQTCTCVPVSLQHFFFLPSS